jgi:hypothetical protein
MLRVVGTPKQEFFVDFDTGANLNGGRSFLLVLDVICRQLELLDHQFTMHNLRGHPRFVFFRKQRASEPQTLLLTSTTKDITIRCRRHILQTASSSTSATVMARCKAIFLKTS